MARKKSTEYAQYPMNELVDYVYEFQRNYNVPIALLCREIGISRATYYRLILEEYPTAGLQTMRQLKRWVEANKHAMNQIQ